MTVKEMKAGECMKLIGLLLLAQFAFYENAGTFTTETRRGVLPGINQSTFVLGKSIVLIYEGFQTI